LNTVEHISTEEPDSLTRKVIEVLIKTQGMKPGEIRPDSTFEELGFDSLDAINIVLSLEKAFDVRIENEVIREITDVHAIVEQLRPLVAARPGDARAATS
jgi:acyl carrier protein